MLGWLQSATYDDQTAERRLLAEMKADELELPEWSAAISPIFDRLLAASAKARPLLVRVLDLPNINAFALPHRTVLVARPLVDFCRDRTAQLAFVLAHEIAHVELGHAGAKHWAGAAAGLARLNPLVGFAVRNLFDRAFSREQEFAADRRGLALARAAGFDADGAIVLLNRLHAESIESAESRSWLSTHPPVSERVAELLKPVS